MSETTATFVLNRSVGAYSAGTPGTVKELDFDIVLFQPYNTAKNSKRIFVDPVLEIPFDYLTQRRDRTQFVNSPNARVKRQNKRRTLKRLRVHESA